MILIYLSIRIGKVFKKYNVGGGLSNRDLDEKFDLIIEANDQLLEKIVSIMLPHFAVKMNDDDVFNLVFFFFFCFFLAC